MSEAEKTAAERGRESGGEVRDLREDAGALREGDFYWDGPYMVFTEAYHLRRGYCCNSGCRHCPYK